MPGAVDRIELRKVSDSLEDRYTKPIDSEKDITDSQFLDDNEDGESQKFLSNGLMKKKKYEEYHEEYHPGHTSFGMSVFNLSNAIMGSGILGLSYAMANTGILLFSFLLVAVAILSLYSVHLLLMTAKEGGSLIYEKLGERAFGWPGKIAAFGSIIMQNIGAMSSYLFIVKYELPEVIRAFLGLEEISGEWYLNGNYLVVFVSIGIILPLSLLKNLGKDSLCTIELNIVQLFRHIMTLNIFCTLFSPQTAYTVPILAFAFVCHPEVLPIYSELKDRSRKKMQNVSNLSIMMMLIMYMMSALVGYLTFYENVEAELLHTFTKVYKFDTMLLLVRLAVLTAVTLTVPIVLFPIRSSITTLLFSGREFSWIRHLLIAAAILAFNNILVIFVPTIRDIFGFIGESLMYTKGSVEQFFFSNKTKKMSQYGEKDLAAVFLVVGVIFMIGSLSLIVLDWIHNPPGSSGGH
uniref:Solute carrier family 38 member 4 n=1 Tax=Cyclopterus lumpus TaxID=8103 RepID=A0A8C2ZKQ8_CYCLU